MMPYWRMNKGAECSLIELEHNVGCANDYNLYTVSLLQHNVVCNEAFSQS